VKIIKKALKCKDVDGKQHSLEHKLAEILLKYMTTPHTTTGVAPAKLLIKRLLSTRLSLLKPSVATRVENHQQKMKINHNKGHYNVEKSEIGERYR
jgi:hypothetical protein